MTYRSTGLVWLLALGVYLFPALTLSQTPAKAKPVPGIMAPLSESILKLQPYLHSQDQFQAAASRRLVREELKKLMHLTKNLSHHERLKTPAFSIPAQSVQRLWNDVYETYRRGEYAEAFSLFHSSLSACSTCHTAIAPKRERIWTFEDQQLVGSPREKADFYFTFRDYARARDLYEAIVLNYPSALNRRADVDHAVLKILAMDLRTKGSLTSAQKSLSTLLSNKALDDSLRGELEAHRRAVQSLKEWGEAPKRSAEFARWAEKRLSELETQALKELDPSALLKVFYLSGLVLRFLDQQPKAISPKLLQLMAQMDDWLSTFFKHSLAELYLEQCVRLFPTTPEAKACYSSLEKRVIARQGDFKHANLPQETRNYLRNLKSLIFP